MRTYFFTFLLLFQISNAYSQWQAVGNGTNNSSHGMCLYNGNLVDVGSFNNPCNRVAQWNGSAWTCFGGGVGLVGRAAIEYNGDLIVVGDFWNVQQPCTNCNGVARWNGTSWSALGTGFNNDVLCVTIWNGYLVAGGDFTTADGNPCSRIAYWNGTTWNPIGALNDFDNDIRALCVYDGELWAGGDFNNVGGCTACDGLVKWNGTNWVGGNSGVDVQGGVDSTVRVFYVDAVNDLLYMGGHFEQLNGDFNMSGVAVYDGSDWFPLGTGVNSYVRALTIYNGNLIVGGDFNTAGGLTANKVAKWNPVSSTWSAMGTGMNDYVKSAEVYNGELYVGGPFTQADGQTRNCIAKWYEVPSVAPVAAFTPSQTTICPAQCISFTDNSSNSPTSWNWTFTGSSTPSSTLQNPSNICYPNPGTYQVTLQACNGSGCNTIFQNITVSVASVNAGNDINICSGGDTTLSASGGVSYLWSPATGLSCTACQNPIASPSSTTTYTVQATSAGACTATDQIVVTVNNIPTANAGNDASICNGNNTPLSATGGGSYTWSPATGLSCTNCQNPIASPNTTTIYTVSVNLNGCTATDQVEVAVNTVNANAGNNTNICLGNSSSLNATGGVSYQWSPSTGLSCTNCQSPIASPTSTTTYQVTVTDGNGCNGSDAVVVTVNSVNANAGNNASICSGNSSSLNATGGVSYQWSPSTGLSCTNCQSPIASPANTTTYQVTVTDGNGCIGYDSLLLQVNVATAYAGMDDTICNGSSTNLNASGGISYQWSPSTGLSCTNCQNPIASPSSDITYSVSVTDANGCTANDNVSVVVLVCSGISEKLSDQNPVLYPNPTSEGFHLIIPEQFLKTNLTITDAIGRVVYTSSLNNTASFISTSHLAAGVYLVRVGVFWYSRLVLKH